MPETLRQYSARSLQMEEVITPHIRSAIQYAFRRRHGMDADSHLAASSHRLAWTLLEDAVAEGELAAAPAPM